MSETKEQKGIKKVISDTIDKVNELVNGNEDLKFYDLSNILEYHATYNFIFGERSNGKTYQVFLHALIMYTERGRQLALIRRYKEDFVGKRGSQMFASLECNGLGENMVKKYSKNKFDSIFYFSSRWYLARYDKSSDKYNPEDTPFAFGFSLTDMEHDKSTSYPNIGIIHFDEVLSRNGYLVDEFVTFMNVVSTIVRYRDDVEIYMTGNTVSKYCPYFQEMGLTHITEMPRGSIELYQYGDSKLTVAVEYAESLNKKKPSDKYFAFDNPKLSMITGGAWEMAMYPHCPFKYRPMDVVFKYFIDFNGELLECEIISKDNSYITFIHRKTTEIKYPDKELIFCNTVHPEYNYGYKITKPVNEIQNKIASFFVKDKVFYQDNEVGEIVHNYIKWCHAN